MENEFENLDSSNEGTENADSSNGEEVDVEALKAENEKVKSQNKQLFERAKKAEGFVLQDGKWIKPALTLKPEEKSETSNKKSEEYSLQDIRALSDIHDDDVAEVVEFAKFKGISIAEAKKHPAVKALLDTNKEFRATEAAKNSGKGKQGTSRMTDAELVDQAASGNLPDDDEGIRRLADARQAEKLAKLEKK